MKVDENRLNQTTVCNEEKIRVMKVDENRLNQTTVCIEEKIRVQ